ncbi:hypothetical protein AVEN_133713-1 [Araneus ventricosus]|uniref:Uncharacterized protein n=1 Tax=Araneus ventricosus TaxID=182803 RepID=A0A4Y2B9U6_ARAVE|nr:hypothetical protein AVEN_133713-1 [Araneus ventricosus]
MLLSEEILLRSKSSGTYFITDARCISPEIENRCPLRKFFIGGKSHMERDQRNKLVVGEPEYDVLTYNLTTGLTCEPKLYRDAPTPNSAAPRS